MKPKLLYFILFLLLSILIIRFDQLLNTFLLLFEWIKIFFSDSKTAINLFDVSLFDHFLSLFLFIISVAATVLLLMKKKFKKIPLDFTSGFLSVLFTILFFAPILKSFDADYQNNISNSKLLPPLSSKKIVFLDLNDRNLNEAEIFMRSKNLLKGSYSQTGYEIITADELKVEDKIEILAGKEIIKYDKNRLEDYQTKIFLFGTDQFGRDIFSRIIYGTRISLLIGLGSVFISLLIGAGFGFISGYYGGFPDKLLNRISEMFLAFPMIFFIILFIAFFGNSLFVVIFVLGFSGWMSLFKLVRGEVIDLKNKDFVVASKKIGFSEFYILTKEMLPILISPLVVNLVLQYGNVILAESALSYLGLGIGNYYPSWGAMIENGQNFLTKAWWISLFPSLFLFFTLLVSNNLGNKLEFRFSGIKKY